MAHIFFDASIGERHFINAKSGPAPPAQKRPPGRSPCGPFPQLPARRPFRRIAGAGPPIQLERNLNCAVTLTRVGTPACATQSFASFAMKGNEVAPRNRPSQPALPFQVAALPEMGGGLRGPVASLISSLAGSRPAEHTAPGGVGLHGHRPTSQRKRWSARPRRFIQPAGPRFFRHEPPTPAFALLVRPPSRSGGCPRGRRHIQTLGALRRPLPAHPCAIFTSFVQNN